MRYLFLLLPFVVGFTCSKQVKNQITFEQEQLKNALSLEEKVIFQNCLSHSIRSESSCLADIAVDRIKRGKNEN